MAIVVFEHAPMETAAAIGQTLLRHNHRLRVVRFHAGDRVPPDLDDVDGIVSMGGPMNVDEVAAHPWIADELAYLKQAHEAQVPIVGVCLGHQLIAAALGGEVKAMAAPEIGWHAIRLAFPGTIDPLFAGIAWESMMFHVHGQEVARLPPGATPLASSAACKMQAFRVGLTTYGFQFHFEWSRRDLQAIVDKDPFVRQHADPAAIAAAIDEHYPGYRRRGDRLCEQIAELLMPIDKRLSRRASLPAAAAAAR